MIDSRSNGLARLPIRVGCGLLAGWVLVLSLAGVSPSLHAWLHADPGGSHACADHAGGDGDKSNDDGHYCGVIALQNAHSVVDPVLPAERSAYQRLLFAPSGERPSSQVSPKCQQARAPPTEIVV